MIKTGINWLGPLVALLGLSMNLFPASAAEKVRLYPFGENDDGAIIGGVAIQTEDILEPPTENADGDPVFDSAGEFVALEALNDDEAPVYVEGLDGPDSLALFFDGDDDRLSSAAFDPRNFSTFSALSQAWVKPDATASGTQQFIWGLGNDNGGVGITEDGRWQIRASSVAAEKISDISVDFDQWTHVGVFRGGNDARLFINGSLAVTSGGFWNGVGEVSVGAMRDGGEPFRGAIDEFNIAGFSDFAFDPTDDLDYEGIQLCDPVVLGDVNQDCDVNVLDYIVWSNNVGFDNKQGFGDSTTLIQGDVDQNGRINFFDFQIIADQAAANGNDLVLVPEPTSSLLFCLGAVFLLRLRRRTS